MNTIAYQHSDTKSSFHLYVIQLIENRQTISKKDFFDRLITKGKPFKTAMTAAMRKLLTIIRSVVTRRTPWVNEAPINI